MKQAIKSIMMILAVGLFLGATPQTAHASFWSDLGDFFGSIFGGGGQNGGSTDDDDSRRTGRVGNLSDYDGDGIPNEFDRSYDGADILVIDGGIYVAPSPNSGYSITGDGRIVHDDLGDVTGVMRWHGEDWPVREDGSDFPIQDIIDGVTSGEMSLSARMNVRSAELLMNYKRQLKEDMENNLNQLIPDIELNFRRKQDFQRIEMANVVDSCTLIPAYEPNCIQIIQENIVRGQVALAALYAVLAEAERMTDYKPNLSTITSIVPLQLNWAHSWETSEGDLRVVPIYHPVRFLQESLHRLQRAEKGLKAFKKNLKAKLVDVNDTMTKLNEQVKKASGNKRATLINKMKQQQRKKDRIKESVQTTNTLLDAIDRIQAQTTL